MEAMIMADPQEGLTNAQEAKIRQFQAFYIDATKANVKESLMGRNSCQPILLGDHMKLCTVHELAELVLQGMGQDELVSLIGEALKLDGDNDTKQKVNAAIDVLAVRTGDRFGENEAISKGYPS